MELFSLLAKLTLDAKDFNKELDDAQKSADSFEAPEEQKLELDTSDYDSGITDAQIQGDGFVKSMDSAFKEVKGLLVGAGIVGIISGIVDGLKQAINMTAETADGIDKGSQRLGVSKAKYQEWDHALKQSGASIQDLSRGVLALNKHLAGEESEDITKAYDKLGISVTKANGKLKTSEELIEESLLALSEMGEGSERDLLVTQLFGKGGTSFNAFLNSGRKGVEDLLKEADELGLVMSDEEITNAVAYGDAVSNLNQELAAIQSAFVADIIPVLKDATEWLTSLLQTFNPRLRENSITETFQKIDEESTKSLTTIKENKTEAEALVKKLAEMGDYWQLDEEDKKKYNSLVEELKKLYPELDKVIGDNTYSINTNKDAILKNIDAWTRLEQQRLLDENIAKKREVVAEKYAKALDKEIEAEVKEAEATAKQETAMEGLNSLLSSTDKKYAKMQEQFQKKFGTGSVNGSNFADALTWFKKNYKPYISDSEGTLTAMDEWTELNNQATSLREEASKMEDEANKAQEELTKYSAALSRKLGITLTDTTKVREEIQALKQELNSMPPGIRVGYQPPRAMTHAIGADYIPYDNYPALLHRGERVLTATEARQDNRGVDLSGLEDRIIQAIQEGMKNAEVNSYLDGQAITDKVSKNLANQMADRRYV